MLQNKDVTDKEALLNYIKEYLTSFGYFYTDGIKFGLDLLVYTHHPDKVHSMFGLIANTSTITYREVVALQRICDSVNKKLLIASMKDSSIEIIQVERFL